MYSNTAEPSSRRVGQERRLISSFFSVAKKLSATALPYASPREPIEIAMPASRAAWPKPSETSARSEWCTRPGSGRRRASAIESGVCDQLCAHVLGHRPADDRARAGILDRSQVQPALPQLRKYVMSASHSTF